MTQAKTEGRIFSRLLPQTCSLYQLVLWAKLGHSKNCFEKIKKYRIYVDSGGALASTSVISLTAKVDMSDVTGCEVSPSLTLCCSLMKRKRQLSRQKRTALQSRFYQCNKGGNYSNSDSLSFSAALHGLRDVSFPGIEPRQALGSENAKS